MQELFTFIGFALFVAFIVWLISTSKSLSIVLGWIGYNVICAGIILFFASIIWLFNTPWASTFYIVIGGGLVAWNIYKIISTFGKAVGGRGFSRGAPWGR